MHTVTKKGFLLPPECNSAYYFSLFLKCFLKKMGKQKKERKKTKQSKKERKKETEKQRGLRGLMNLAESLAGSGARRGGGRRAAVR